MLGELKILFNKQYWVAVYFVTQERLIVLYGKSKTGLILPVLKPTIQSLLYAFVMKRFMVSDEGNYTAFVMIGMSIWNFISSLIVGASSGFAMSLMIIKSKQVNRSIFTLAYIVERCILDGIAIVVVCIYVFAVLKLQFTFLTPVALIYIGVAIAISAMVAFGLSYINLYNQDLNIIVSLAIPMMLWVTPILYSIDKVSGLFRIVSEYNPFYIMINPVVQIMYYHRMPTLFMNIQLIVLFLLTFVIMYIIYKKLAKNMIYYIS